MVEVGRGQLQGFRRPEKEEISAIQNYLIPVIARLRRIQLAWIIGCGFLFVMTGIGAAEILLNGQESMGAVIMNVLIVAAFGIAFFSLRKSRRQNRRLLDKISQGDFLVLDCISVKFDPHTNSVNLGVVKIRTQDGQYCGSNFTIDRQTAAEYKGEREVPLLLMKQEELDYYEMFTRRKLNGR